jgi:hypothetical protein
MKNVKPRFVETLVESAARAAWSRLGWAAVTLVTVPFRLAVTWLTPAEREKAAARDLWRMVTNAVAWAGARLSDAEPVVDGALDRGQQLLALGLVLAREGTGRLWPCLARLGRTGAAGLWFLALVVAWLLRLGRPVALSVAAGTWAALSWLARVVASIDWRRAVEPPEPAVPRDGRGVPVALPQERGGPAEVLRRAA